MKKSVFALSLLACTAHLAAQDISPYLPGEDEGIVYFLPKTMLEVNVIATRITYHPGELCQYANQYLRMNNVSAEPETYWEIKQIEVRSAGVPDSTKAYIIKLKDKSDMGNVELTESGLIKAINASAPENKPMEYILEKPQKHENPRRYMTEDNHAQGRSFPPIGHRQFRQARKSADPTLCRNNRTRRQGFHRPYCSARAT